MNQFSILKIGRIIVLAAFVAVADFALCAGTEFRHELSPFDTAGMQLVDNGSKKRRRPKSRKNSRPPERQAPSTSKPETVSKSDDPQKIENSSRRTPKMSVETNPLGLLFSAYNVEVNLKLNERMTIGALGAYANYGFISAFSAGANVYYYMDQLFENWFVTGGGVFGKGQGSFLDYGYQVTTINLYGMGGYKWLWPSFMISLGGGLQIMQTSYSTTYSGADDSFPTEDAPKPPIKGTGASVMFNIGIPIY